jgi:hypothetical protein
MGKQDGGLDPRFAKMMTDPRFQRFPKKQNKVEIDERFTGDSGRGIFPGASRRRTRRRERRPPQRCFLAAACERCPCCYRRRQPSLCDTNKTALKPSRAPRTSDPLLLSPRRCQHPHHPQTGLFSDPDFQARAPVDKRGRKSGGKAANGDDMRRYYRMRDEDAPGGSKAEGGEADDAAAAGEAAAAPKAGAARAGAGARRGREGKGEEEADSEAKERWARARGLIGERSIGVRGWLFAVCCRRLCVPTRPPSISPPTPSTLHLLPLDVSSSDDEDDTSDAEEEEERPKKGGRATAAAVAGGGDEDDDEQDDEEEEAGEESEDGISMDSQEWGAGAHAGGNRETVPGSEVSGLS